MARGHAASSTERSKPTKAAPRAVRTEGAKRPAETREKKYTEPQQAMGQLVQTGSTLNVMSPPSLASGSQVGEALGGAQKWAGEVASHFSAMAQGIESQLFGRDASIDRKDDTDISRNAEQEPSEAFQSEFEGVRSEAGQGAWEKRELVYTGKKGQRVYRFAANPNGSLRDRTWYRRVAGVGPVVYVSESANDKVVGFAITAQGETVGHYGNAIYIHNLRGEGGCGKVLDGIVFESDESNRPAVADPANGTLMFYQRHGSQLDGWNLIHRPGVYGGDPVKLKRRLVEVWLSWMNDWIGDSALFSMIGKASQTLQPGDIKEWFTEKLRGQVGESVKARVIDKKNTPQKEWTGTLEEFRDQFFSFPGESDGYAKT